MTCKHVNIGEITAGYCLLTFTNIRETTIEVNEYNSECTRVVLHIYEGFTWYLITIIVPLQYNTTYLAEIHSGIHVITSYNVY